MTFLLPLHSKSHFFPLKTDAKAHTKLRKGKTSITKPLPTQKDAIQKVLHTKFRKIDTSGMWGDTFAVFFFNNQTSWYRNASNCRQRQRLL